MSLLWHRGVAVVNLPVRPAELTHPGVRPTLLLRDAGFDVHVVTRGTQAQQADTDGVHVWIEPTTISTLRRVATLRAEFLFVESSTYGAITGGLARRSWIRNPRRASRPSVRRLQAAALGRFDAVSFTNPAERALWQLRAGQDGDLAYPVDVSWWGEPVARRESWWAERGWPVPRGPVLVCNAAFERHKRHAELLEGLAPLLSDDPTAVLVLFGHRWIEPEIWEMVRTRPRELGIGEQVLVTDWISYEEIRELLAWTTLTIINSTRETQCLAVYESLAAGVPALISAIPELVSQFPELPAHADGSQMRRHAERVIGDPAHGRRLVDTARERVLWADLPRHDEVFRQTVSRLLGRSFGTR